MTANGQQIVFPTTPTTAETHLDTCLRSSGGSFRRDTGMGREINHSPPCSVEVKNERSDTSPPPPPYACMSYTVACFEIHKKLRRFAPAVLLALRNLTNGVKFKRLFVSQVVVVVGSSST